MSNRTLNAQVGLQLRMLDRLADSSGEGTGASSSRGRFRLASAGAIGAMLFAPVLAVADPTKADCAVGSTKNSGTGATSSLTSLIETAANFLIIIGGALAILMFAIGGFMIMGLGGTKNAKKGFTVVKNALIGLAIMVSGIFIRTVILNFIDGGTGGTNKAKCVQGAFGAKK